MRGYNVRLQQLVSHDPLTGVMNARAYYAACNQYIALSQRQGQPFAVLFVDLDHFKSDNDTHGHAAGHEVLRTVATTLRQKLRSTDLLGRIGGEVFCSFLPVTKPEGAFRLAEDPRLAVQACQPQITPDQRLTITASTGQETSLQALQHQADEALYQAKRSGRNRVSTLRVAA